jgi:hypothetical protein
MRPGELLRCEADCDEARASSGEPPWQIICAATMKASWRSLRQRVRYRLMISAQPGGTADLTAVATGLSSGAFSLLLEQTSEARRGTPPGGFRVSAMTHHAAAGRRDGP